MVSFESSVERFEKLKKETSLNEKTVECNVKNEYLDEKTNKSKVETVDNNKTVDNKTNNETDFFDFDNEENGTFSNDLGIDENKDTDENFDNFENTAKNLKYSMDKIFKRIKSEMDGTNVQNNISKDIIDTNILKTGSEGNNDLLEVINNKLDILLAINNEQSSKLDEITLEIDKVLTTIDENSEKIIDLIDAQNIKISGLLTILQEIYEGVQEIKYILKNFTPENIDKASNVVDKLKNKIDNYMGNVNSEIEA
jgi:hypothetical protein